MEPFASLKFYLQAAQELGLVKLLHHGSRCLLKVSNSERLQLWANTNPNSTLISSNMNSTNNTSGNGVNTNSFQNTSSINTPSIRLPQRSLTERELAPFLPLLHAFCLARMRYPPPIRTPAIGPLLKPLFAQNQLPWKKLSEYLTEAERQGVVRLNKLGVNGDVQIWICEHVCGEVWQRLKHRHGPFREASSEPTTNPLDSKEYANGGANLNPSEGTSSHLPLNYPNLHWEMAAHANGNPPSMSSPKLTTGSFVKPIASNLSASKDHVDTTMVNNIAKLWDQNVTFSPQAPSSTFPPEKNDVTSDSFSLAFPFSYTPWGAANKSNPSTDHFINKQNPTHFLNIPIKCPSPVDSLKAQPQGNVYYTPWSTPSFLHLECEKSTAL
ncbi:hypothetical protein HMI54_009024 [Coelomomyces lativittatus]|nr:hypothetical protein HMI54_009024 [Coelomomyces lativittatus]